MEFRGFEKIERLSKLQFAITQKIHGTNAQIVVAPTLSLIGTEVGGKWYQVYCGSRTRWITPTSDNFGFAAWVEKNKVEIIEKLGPGTHFGEWAGPGINSGEGLSERTFVLFDWWKFPPERPLPPQTVLVPLLYHGDVDLTKIEEVMADLKANGSKLVPGFMRPEGIVVQINGVRFKKVFESEETQWKRGSEGKNTRPKSTTDYTYLCQPIRLEKLLSRDERYTRDYPKSLPSIVKDYVADLLAESQISGTEDEIKVITKDASGQIFKFVKSTVESL